MDKLGKVAWAAGLGQSYAVSSVNQQQSTAHTSNSDANKTFAQLGLHPQTLAAVRMMNWSTPTAVQSSVIPLALAGKDVVAVAPTGTGKTGAYTLPLHSLYEIQKPPLKPARPWAVVLVPTRELAAQVAHVLRGIFREAQQLVAEVTGGVGFSTQRQHLSSPLAVLVATPGRCEDLIQRGDLSLETVQHWVLDEMDRMLDFGFRGPVRRLIMKSGTHRRNQLLLFSATEGRIKDVFRELGLRHAERVEITNPNMVPAMLQEGVYQVTAKRKIQILTTMIQHWQPRRALVFVSRRDMVEQVVQTLKDTGLPAQGLHAAHSMTARREAMNRFKAAKSAILVATDLAGRGLDVHGIELVVHLSVPRTKEQYIHRSGRTARANMPGRAVIVVSKDDLHDLENLERKLGRTLPRRRLPGFDNARAPSAIGNIRVSLTGRAIAVRRPGRRIFQHKAAT